MQSYEKWWLPKDMENMGYMFEYCDKYCMEIYGCKIDKKKLLTAFMNSGFRRAMEKGHPKFLSQSAKDSLTQWISTDYDGDLAGFTEPIHDNYSNYANNQFYWVGWIYAYIHYKSRLSSKTIVSRMPIDMMLEQYYLGHEMSKESFYSHIQDQLKTRETDVLN